jgi:23S rRNA pseudouridine1911/1915/1917 synthase
MKDREMISSAIVSNSIDNNRVLWRNRDCMVINKLPGEPAERPFSLNAGDDDSGGGAGEKGLWTPVHRLDVPVSGCLLLARTPQATAFVSAAFSRTGEGIVEKRYWAVVELPPEGLPLPPGGQWIEAVHWIVTDSKRNKSTAYTENKKGSKKAALRWRLVGRGDRYLFIEVDLFTGRHHQIRAQFAALGLRVKGDLKYGARRSEPGGGIRLHASALAFPDPLNPGETVHVRGLPPVMDNLWSAFAEAAGSNSEFKITTDGHERINE